MSWWWTVQQQVSFTILSPSLGSRLGRPRCLATLPVSSAVRQPEADVRFPATASIRSDCHAHRLYSCGDGVRLWSRKSSRSVLRTSKRLPMRVTPGKRPRSIMAYTICVVRRHLRARPSEPRSGKCDRHSTPCGLWARAIFDRANPSSSPAGQVRTRRFAETPKCACWPALAVLQGSACAAACEFERTFAVVPTPIARNQTSVDGRPRREKSNTPRSCGRLSRESSHSSSSPLVRRAGMPLCSTAASTAAPTRILRRVSRLRSEWLLRAARRLRSERRCASRSSRARMRTWAFVSPDVTYFRRCAPLVGRIRPLYAFVNAESRGFAVNGALGAVSGDEGGVSGT